MVTEIYDKAFILLSSEFGKDVYEGIVPQGFKGCGFFVEKPIASFESGLNGRFKEIVKLTVYCKAKNEQEIKDIEESLYILFKKLDLDKYSLLGADFSSKREGDLLTFNVTYSSFFYAKDISPLMERLFVE